MLNKKIYAILCLFSILSFSILSSSYALAPYIWSNSDSTVETASNSNTTNFDLKSGGAILIEQSSGQVLYEHNAHEMFRPASVTKVMSLLLIMEALDNRTIFFN